MSEPIPESIPTSMLRSGRPAKRARATDAAAVQSSQIEALFANPDRPLEVAIGPKGRVLAAPAEIVANVQGSSAGAGSGEFHVYKASRRREYERLRQMDEEVETEKADQEWQERREEIRRKDEAKLSKNRARREKQKARLAKSKDTKATDNNDDTMNVEIDAVKKKAGPARVISNSNDTNGTNGESAAATTTTEETGITFLEDD